MLEVKLPDELKFRSYPFKSNTAPLLMLNVAMVRVPSKTGLVPAEPMLTASPVDGTPEGDQLPAVAQSVELAPVQE
ncbi:MAG: hypothetical protein R2850_07530 [Bacteroidia bacterium]